MYQVLLLTMTLMVNMCRSAPSYNAQKRQATDRYVFAHYMVRQELRMKSDSRLLLQMGIVDRKSADDYDTEFRLAKVAGIDAFALNMGPEVSNDQIGYAYESANRVGVKAFSTLR